MFKKEDDYLGKKYWDDKEKERQEYMKEIKNDDKVKEGFSEKQRAEILKNIK